MGCDIHLVLERRSGSKWFAVNTFQGHANANRKAGDFMAQTYPAATQRNYTRFARLAGVRGKGPEPKGLPLDASETTKFLSDDYGEDGHSHSYMSVEEAVRIFSDTERWRDDEKEDGYARKYPASFFFGVEPSRGETIDDYRIVFWFDN